MSLPPSRHLLPRATLLAAALAASPLARAQTILDGTSGSTANATSYSTTGGLTLGLGFFADYLIVAGGGGGGNGGGGGGGGGLLEGNLQLTAASHAVTVGAGGAAGTSTQGGNGGNSVFRTLTANGGGGGGGLATVGRAGGSGGGGGSRGASGGNSNKSSGFGNAGGTGSSGFDGGDLGGGGGGGAGAVGGNAPSNGGGNGGAGRANSITGSSVTYSGGGGGGRGDRAGNGATGGAGGGGNGGFGSTTAPVAGTNGLGGGGGGGGAVDGITYNGAAGGSGIVIVRYAGASLGAIGGTVSAGSGTAAGSTLHTFTTVGTAALNMASVDLDARLGTILSSAVTGTGNLTFNGPGRLTLAANSTYSGTTTVSGGTLLVGNGSTAGSLGGGAVTNNARLVFNRSNALAVSNAISGTGSLTQQGAGELTLSATNTYSGGTTLAAGTLVLGSSGALGTSGTITFSGGTLRHTAANTADYSARFSTAANQAVAIDTNGQSVTLATALTSAGGSLAKSGAGTLTLTGANTYAGGTTVSDGTLALGAAERLADSAALSVSGGTLDLGGFAETVGQVTLVSGTLANGTLTAAALTAQSGIISAALAGAAALTKSTAGTLTLSGANTYSGGTTVNGGRLVGDATSLQGAIANFATLEFAQVAAGTYAGVLSGTGLVVKTGAGTLTLAGDNTFSGGLRIEAGTVLAGVGGKRETLGADANTVTLAGVGATLRAAASVSSVLHNFLLEQTGAIDTNGFTLTLSGTVAGEGGLTKLGSGTLELDGTGAFTGTLAVNQGTLIVSGAAALRAGADVSLADAAGVLFHTHVDQTLGRLTGGGSAGGVADLDGKILSVGSGDVTFAFDGRLAGSNASQFRKVGAGALTLTNTATNDDFTGTVKVSGGSLRISAVESLGKRGTSRTLYLENGGELALLDDLSFNTRTFHLGAADATGAAGVFRVADGKTATLRALVADDLHSGSGALVKDGAGTLVLEGGNTYTGGTVIRAGTLVAGLGGNRSTLGPDSGDLTFDGAGATLRIAASVSGSVRDYHYLQTGTIDTAGFNLELNGSSDGSGGLTKTGLGTLTLGGAQDHAGLTTVAAGKLVVNGTLAGSATVASGATLGGSGTLAGDVTVAGTHSPGNSPGIQTIQGNLTYGAASALVWELAAQTTSNSPLAFDQIIVGGDLTFAGATSLSLVFNAAGSAVAFSNAFWSTAQTWTLFDVAGDLTGLADLQIASVSRDSTGALLGAVRPGSTFSLSQLGSDIQITYSPVPEPSTYGLLLGALALAGAALRRRARRPSGTAAQR